MSSRIKELALPATLAVLLMVCPAIVIAAETGTGLNINPLTAAWSAGEWIVDKATAKPKISFAEAQSQAREEWKNDPYVCMWDPNWIRKYKRDVCL